MKEQHRGILQAMGLFCIDCDGGYIFFAFVNRTVHTKKVNFIAYKNKF